MGTRVSADKIRQSEHESASQMVEVHDKNQTKNKLDTNEEAGSFQIF